MNPTDRDHLRCVRKHDWTDRVFGTPFLVLGLLPFLCVVAFGLAYLFDQQRRGTLGQIDGKSWIIFAVAAALTFPFFYYSVLGLRGLYRVIEIWSDRIVDRWGPLKKVTPLARIETLECRASRYYKFGLYVRTNLKVRVKAGRRTIRFMCRYNEVPKLPVAGNEEFEPDRAMDDGLSAIEGAIADRLEHQLKDNGEVRFGPLCLRAVGVKVAADQGKDRSVRWKDVTRVEASRATLPAPKLKLFAFGDARPIATVTRLENYGAAVNLLKRFAPQGFQEQPEGAPVSATAGL
ncbi:MAG TPA: hypothetical protein VD997_02215 [Phycisphaerales bacterium]|nr:hypothetical protein [Phycisphaerales bacterium]